MSGSAVAQAISLAISPVISRLFSPADFGLFGSFSSVAGILLAGATLDYTQAIMLPKEKDDAFNLLAVSCLCTFAMGSLFGIFCLINPTAANSLLKTDNFWIPLLLVFSVLAGGINASCQAWCVRAKAFKHTSASQVVRSLSSNGLQLSFGSLKSGPIGLILSDVLADVVATLNLLRVIAGDFKTRKHSVTWERMKQLAREYRDFPLYSASQNVINALSAGLPVLLLTKYYGIEVAGVYAFSMRILNAPMSLILRALRQVLFQKAGETVHEGRALVPLYFKVTAGLLACALLPCLAIVLWAPELFSWLFGARWSMAGEFARSLIPWLLLAFCNLPAVLFARLIRIQRTVFFYDLVLLAGRTCVLVLGGQNLTANQTILSFSGVGALMNGILILIVGRALMKKEGDVSWKSVFRET